MMPTRYMAKPETWFLAGTPVELVEDYRPGYQGGVFRGPRRCTLPMEEDHALGEIYEDEELCLFDEFSCVND